jgi:SAM-dependent methyltransferase
MIADSAAPYDRLADVFDVDVPFYGTFGRRIVRELAPPAGSRVLDIGAGNGALTAPLAACGCTVLALDAAPSMLRVLRRRAADVPVLLADAERLPVRTASVDLVTAGFVVDLLDHPAGVAAETLRVLRPDGRFALTLPARTSFVGDWAFCNRLFAEFARDSVTERPAARTVDGAEMLRRCGFVVITRTTLTADIPVPSPQHGWRFLQTSGTGTFFDGLPEHRRAEFRSRFETALEQRGGATTMTRDTDLWVGRRPFAPVQPSGAGGNRSSTRAAIRPPTISR